YIPRALPSIDLFFTLLADISDIFRTKRDMGGNSCGGFSVFHYGGSLPVRLYAKIKHWRIQVLTATN
ncbi:hypothetical protein EZS27_022635, partial [termite gut metagenome]